MDWRRKHRRGVGWRRRVQRRNRGAWARLFVEPLESRSLLTVNPLLPGVEAYSFVSSLWFEALSQSASSGGVSGLSTGGPDSDPSGLPSVESNPGVSEWIVRLTSGALETIHSVSGAAAALNSDALGLSVVQGLGLPGQLLVRATAAAADVETYLAGLNLLSYFHSNDILSVQATPDDPSFSQLYGLHNTGQTGGTADADID